MSNKDVRKSEKDRRSEPDPADEKSAYTGTERRSGKDRRIWINRIREIRSKI
jgi:hypothetical protein